MSNCYINTAFAFTATANEATLLQAAIAAAKLLDNEPTDDDVAAFWETQDDAFHEAFPPTDEKPLSGLLTLFDDPEYPCLDTNFTFETTADGTIHVFAWADQFDPGSTAAIIQRCVRSSLPIVAEYSYDSDRHRIGSFGGGAFSIDTDGIRWINTSDINNGPEYVIQALTEIGFLYWNSERGFVTLPEATVFPQHQQAKTPLPTAPKAQWVALPRSR